MHGAFNKVEENQKRCVIMQDEIYVKKMLLCHGENLFGRETDDALPLQKLY